MKKIFLCIPIASFIACGGSEFTQNYKNSPEVDSGIDANIDVNNDVLEQDVLNDSALDVKEDSETNDVNTSDIVEDTSNDIIEDVAVDSPDDVFAETYEDVVQDINNDTAEDVIADVAQDIVMDTELDINNDIVEDVAEDNSNDVVLTCTHPLTNCNNDVSDGCEAHLLIDPLNCGTCGNDCYSNICSNGKCAPKTIGADLTNPVSLINDSSHVYWADNTGIHRYAKYNNLTELFLVTNTTTLAEFSNYLFFTCYLNSICKMKKSTKEVTVVIDSYPGTHAVYYSDEFIYRTSVNAYFDVISVNGGLPYTLSDLPGSREMTSDSSYVYWTNYDNKKVFFVEKSSFTVSSFEWMYKPYDIDCDNDYVFVTNPTVGIISRIVKATNMVEDIIVGLTNPWEISVQGNNIYWTDTLDLKIRKANLDGTNVEIMAENQTGAYSITTDDNYVYWSLNVPGGKVYALER